MPGPFTTAQSARIAEPIAQGNDERGQVTIPSIMASKSSLQTWPLVRVIAVGLPSKKRFTAGVAWN